MSQPAEGGDADPPSEGLAPAEAFALLGDDARIAILRALWEREAETPVPFSELYDAVDVDDSARFNYHLKRLTDHFVAKTDDGYAFRAAGWKVVRAVFAGTFNEREDLAPFDAPGDCCGCGGDLRARYADETLTIACADCGTVHVAYPFAPGGLADRGPAELLEAFHRHVRHHYCLAADGVCPECMGRSETRFETDPDRDLLDVAVVHECQRCDNRLTSSVGLNLLDTAEVLAFHADRGCDLSTAPFWTFDWCVSDAHTTVESADPIRVRVDIPCGDDRIAVRVDESMTPLSVGVAEGVAAAGE